MACASALVFSSIGFSADAPDPEILELLALDLRALNNRSYTASRSDDSSFIQSPAIVTIIGREEIRRRGFKNIHDVLATVPGFFNSPSPFTESISNRGFVQNVNTNYLLLIDGHALNNFGARGLATDHMMPGLQYVKQIEIVRGPLSTLWGRDANMGIIHIVTDDPGDFPVIDNDRGSFRVNIDYDLTQKRRIAELLYQKDFNDGGMSLSSTFFASDPTWTASFEPGDDDFALRTSRTINYWDFQPSHRTYLKIQRGQWRLMAGQQRFSALSPLFSPWNEENQSVFTSDKKWVEWIGDIDWWPSWNIRSRVYYDNFQQRRRTTLPLDTLRKESMQTDGYGVEVLVTHEQENGSSMFGAFADQKRYRSPIADYQDGQVIAASDLLPRFTDRNWAIFAEHRTNYWDNWQITGGFRLARNSPRDTSTQILPRFTAIYDFPSRVSLLYAYSTGFVLPTALQSRSADIAPLFGTDPVIYIKGADRAQASQSHNLQLKVRTDALDVAATLFHQSVDDVIQFIGFGAGTFQLGDQEVVLFETNVSDFFSNGIELSFRYEPTDTVEIYGNYSFVDTKYRDRFVMFSGVEIFDIVQDSTVADLSLRVTGTPKQIWNLGIYWQIEPNWGLNVHYRGYTDTVAKRSTLPTFKRFGAEHYVDVNLNWTYDESSDWQVSFYVKNLFDNRDPLPDGVNGGYVENPNGRQLGFQASFSF